MLRKDALPVATKVEINGIAPGQYLVTPYATVSGRTLTLFTANSTKEGCVTFSTPAIGSDLAFAIRRL